MCVIVLFVRHRVGFHNATRDMVTLSFWSILACDKGRYQALKVTMNANKKDRIIELIESTRKFRFCGPSDDPDEQTNVTAGYRYLVIRFKRLAGPILPAAAAAHLNTIDVEINNLYSAYDAKAELDALLPDIEAALERLDADGVSLVSPEGLSVIADSRLDELRMLASAQFDFAKLVRLCEEINSAYGQKCYFATAMLVRGLLDHVPPVFGKASFSEVANNYGGGGKSFRETMHHMENAARKVADAHLHMPIRKSETLPTAQQVNCGQQLDVLLSEIVRISQ